MLIRCCGGWLYVGLLDGLGRGMIGVVYDVLLVECGIPLFLIPWRIYVSRETLGKDKEGSVSLAVCGFLLVHMLGNSSLNMISRARVMYE